MDPSHFLEYLYQTLTSYKVYQPFICRNADSRSATKKCLVSCAELVLDIDTKTQRVILKKKVGFFFSFFLQTQGRQTSDVQTVVIGMAVVSVTIVKFPAMISCNVYCAVYAYNTVYS